MTCSSERGCPLCGARHEAEVVRPDGRQVARCDACGLWYVRSIAAGEHPASTLASPDPDGSVRVKRLAVLAGGLKNKRLLSLGHEDAEFLQGVRRQGAAVARNGASGLFDVVVTGNVLGVAEEPLAVFEGAVKALRPRGLLLTLSQNGGAGSKCWAGFRCDLDQLQYFSSRTIGLLAQRYECRIEHLETLGFAVQREEIEGSGMAREFLRGMRAGRSLLTSRPRDPRAGDHWLLAILRIDG